MNIFQQCWANWIRAPFGQPDVNEHVWLNEFNQAVFSALEKNLPAGIKVYAVNTPTFIYRTEAAGVYGMDAHTGRVESYRLLLPKEGTFEERVDAAFVQMKAYIERPSVRIVFLYSPIVPCGEKNLEGEPNRHMMLVRLMTTSETLDMEEPT